MRHEPFGCAQGRLREESAFDVSAGEAFSAGVCEYTLGALLAGGGLMVWRKRRLTA